MVQREHSSESDWFATFRALAGLPTITTTAPLSIDGRDVWPNLVDPASSPHRGPLGEVLIAEHVLRQGNFKLISGTGNESWTNGMLRDCMLGTGGGWLLPPIKGNGNQCHPLDVYTRPPESETSGQSEVGCGQNSSAFNPDAGILVSFHKMRWR